MMDPRKQRSKINLLIMAGFQGRIILVVVLAGFFCTAVNGYFYYSYVVESYDFILKYSSLSKELIEARYQDLFVFGVSLGLVNLVIVVIVATWTLIITHRAAGSVYHIRRVIREIKSGNTKARVHLREKDEFQNLAESFNQMMDELQEKHLLSTKNPS